MIRTRPGGAGSKVNRYEALPRSAAPGVEADDGRLPGLPGRDALGARGEEVLIRTRAGDREGREEESEDDLDSMLLGIHRRMS